MSIEQWCPVLEAERERGDVRGLPVGLQEAWRWDLPRIKKL